MLLSIFYSDFRTDEDFSENFVASIVFVRRIDGEGDAICRGGILKIRIVKL